MGYYFSKYVHLSYSRDNNNIRDEYIINHEANNKNNKNNKNEQSKMNNQSIIIVNKEESFKTKRESNIMIKDSLINNHNNINNIYGKIDNENDDNIEAQLREIFQSAIDVLAYYYSNISHNSIIYLSKVEVYNQAKNICISIEAKYINSVICICGDEAFLKININTQNDKKYGIYFRPCNICACSNVVEYT